MYRSRLQGLEEKRNLRAAILVFVVTAILLGLIGWVGLKQLPRLASLLSNSNTKTVDKNDLIPPPPPIFNLPFSATNSATIDLPGSAEPESSVFLTQNDESRGSEKVSRDGTFAFSSLPLKEGVNNFRAVASDPAGNQSKSSQTLSVLYLNKQPEINIDSPSDGQTVNSRLLEVKGAIDPDNHLTVNDRLVMVDFSGKFSTKLTLQAGENTITLIVTDKAGNQLKKELRVTLAN